MVAAEVVLSVPIFGCNTNDAGRSHEIGKIVERAVVAVGGVHRR